MLTSIVPMKYNDMIVLSALFQSLKKKVTFQIASFHDNNQIWEDTAAHVSRLRFTFSFRTEVLFLKGCPHICNIFLSLGPEAGTELLGCQSPGSNKVPNKQTKN